MEFRTVTDRRELTKVASCFNQCEAREIGEIYEKYGYTAIGSVNDIDDHKFGVYIKDFLSPRKF